jgi:RHS repeat-associated protein
MGENLRMVYGITGEMLAEYDGATNNLEKEYLYGANGLAATIESGVGTQYVTADTLGSARLITNSTGAVISRRDYQPFGEELFLAGGRTIAQGYSSPTDNLRQKFTGKERDEETGLDYFGERYYSSTQGRFTTVDSLMASAKSSNPQTWSRYAYVLNNPLSYVDPTGEEEHPATEEEQPATQDPIIKFEKFGTVKVLGKSLTVYVAANQSKEQKEKQFSQFAAGAGSINAHASELTKEEKATIGTITALVALPAGIEYGQTFSAQGIDNVMVNGNWTEGVDTNSGTVFFTAGRLEGQTAEQTASDIGHEGKHKRDADTRTGAEAPGALFRLGPRRASDLSERRADQFQLRLYRKLVGLKPTQDDAVTKSLKDDIRSPHKGAAIY